MRLSLQRQRRDSRRRPDVGAVPDDGWSREPRELTRHGVGGTGSPRRQVVGAEHRAAAGK